ncbi:hypothetical protein KQX54_020303 [Cotesia glomerata]|uniref:Uncharacterized protein n=1 Tax=Cotesia glomerata TaxID=32391 RepID=A0AAV7IUL3_COTGL|nr:hypothetical protein KQX54_020303 [Cotesia glomerata]
MSNKEMCAICIRSITAEHAVMSDVSDVTDFVADKCPICFIPQPQPESITKILQNINEKLGLIKDVKMEIHGVVKKLDELNNICKNLQENYVNLEKRVAAVENASAVSSEVDHNSNSVKLTQSIEVRQLLLEMQQLSDQLVVSGVPEMPTEDLEDIVINLSNSLGLQGIDVNGVSSVERLRKRKIAVAGADSSRSRDIVIK